MLNIPHVHQAVGASCGVASWLMCYLYLKGEENIPWMRERSLYGEAWLNLGDEGVEPDRFVIASEKVGLHAEVKIGATVEDLKAWQKEAVPAILLLQAWPRKPPADWSKVNGEGHYVVSCGVDGQNLVVRDPTLWCSPGFIPLEELEPRWRGPIVGNANAVGVAIPIWGEKPVKLEPIRVL